MTPLARPLISRLMLPLAGAALAAAFPSTAHSQQTQATTVQSGLRAEYFHGMDLTGPALTRTDPTIDFHWQRDAPDPSIDPETFSARWTGQLQPLFSETYTFFTTTDDGVRLWIDNQLLIDNWTDHAATVDLGRIALEAGRLYDLKMEYYENTYDAVATLEWASPSQPQQIIPPAQLFASPPSPPSSPSSPSSPTAPSSPSPPTADPGTSAAGFLAEYFHDKNLTNTALTRTDPAIDFDWGQGSPDPAIDDDTFSARWTGRVTPLHSETYTFYTTSDDGVRLWIDGKLLIDNWTDHYNQTDTAEIDLEAGKPYDLRMEHYENTGGSVARLEWQSPSQPRQVVAADDPNADPSPPPRDPIDPPAPNRPPPPTPGLFAEYFHDKHLTDLALTRTDPQIDFDWGQGSPDPAIDDNTFSARWTGQVTPLHSETYTFYTTSDDGVRLWIDGNLLIDNWTDHYNQIDTAEIDLEAGKPYDLRMEHYENTGGAVARLEWESPSQGREVVQDTHVKQFEDTLPAFPGAYGFGASASGGRGGEVYHVTTLADSGKGSLREGVKPSNAPRTIVFDVGGDIVLQSPLRIYRNDLTIAGQTAPGNGVQICHYPVDIRGENLIIRHLRVRLGDANAADREAGVFRDRVIPYKEGKGNRNLHATVADAVRVIYSRRVILDQLSVSWGMDETLSVTDSNEITVQNCLVSESLNESYHPKGPHGHGSLINGNGARGYTFYRNLYAHHQFRNPGYHSSSPEINLELDFASNVIYNWGRLGTHSIGSMHATKVNLTDNYYLVGPSTLDPKESLVIDHHGVYLNGNMIDPDGISGTNLMPAIDYLFNSDSSAFLKQRHNFPAVPSHRADQALAWVLDHAGAFMNRDAIDNRIVRDVRNGTGGIIDSQDDVGGYVSLKKATAPLDTDRDGMPDEWEIQNELNVTDSTDGNGISPSGYTYLEVYLNSLIRHE